MGSLAIGGGRFGIQFSKASLYSSTRTRALLVTQIPLHGSQRPQDSLCGRRLLQQPAQQQHVQHQIATVSGPPKEQNYRDDNVHDVENNGSHNPQNFFDRIQDGAHRRYLLSSHLDVTMTKRPFHSSSSLSSLVSQTTPEQQQARQKNDSPLFRKTKIADMVVDRTMDRSMRLIQDSMKQQSGIKNLIKDLCTAAKEGNHHKAEMLLEQMIDEYNVNNTQHPPDKHIFNMVLGSYYSRLNVAASRKKMETLVDRMDDLSQPPTSWNTKPNISTYTILIACLSKIQYGRRGNWVGNSVLPTAEALHTEVSRKYQKGDAEFVPTKWYYTGIMNVFARAGQAEKAEGILEEMHSDYKTNGNRDAKVKDMHIGIVMNGWAKSKQWRAPQRAEALLKWVWDASNEGTMSFKPNRYMYSAAIDCWSRSSAVDAPNRAEALLREMIERSSTTTVKEIEKAGGQSNDNDKIDRNLHPDGVNYGAVMDAFAKQGNVTKAHVILEEMKELYNKHGLSKCKPNRIHYNICLHALRKSELDSAPQQAESILSQMWNDYESNDHDYEIKPNYITYNEVMSCHARKNDLISAKRIEELFHDIENRRKNGDPGFKNNKTPFQILLHSYARLGEFGKVNTLVKEYTVRPATVATKNNDSNSISQRSSDGDSAGTNQVIYEADTSLFNVLLDACAKMEPAQPKRAEKILATMWQMYESGNKAVQPNKISYSCVIHCWASLTGERNAIRAEEYLRRQIKLWETADNDHTRRRFQPNIVTYGACMKAYAAVGNPAKVESLLHEMYDNYLKTGNKDCQPTYVAYNMVMNAWCQSDEEKGPERCEAILRKMQELDSANQLNVRPDAKAYSIAINAYARSRRVDAAENAERLLQEMKDRSNSGATILRPDSHAYGAVISAYHKSRRYTDDDAIQRVVELWDEMVTSTAAGDARAAPKVETYNRVLGFLEFGRGTEKQMERIVSHMKENNVRPDSATRRICQSINPTFWNN